MSEARSVRDFGFERFIATQTVAAYEVIQTPAGKAGFHDNPVAAASGDYVTVRTSGTATLQKTTGFVALRGGRAYWDHSANKVHYKKVNDRDFYIGRFAQDATSAADSCEVLLNEDPPYDLDLARDPFLTTLVGTPAAGGFGYPVRLGGAFIFELTATNEAQKCDALSVDGFSKDANAVIEGAFRVSSDGAGAVVDASVGIANGTHASDADSITESLFVHLDANNTNINLESDDGTTEVAATDTTLDYTEGTAVANRVEFWIDLRDLTDIQCYVNGSVALTATVFRLDAATGPLFLLVHVEKSASTDTYKLAVDWLRARYTEH